METPMKTQLDFIQDHEAQRRDELWMTQPMGGGQLKTYTFGQALDEARRMATHLQSLGLPPGTRVAIFSKNTAWWLMADLAIWLGGFVSVPVYPTLTAASIRQILEHSEAKVVFVGKLDGFPSMEPGLVEGVQRIALPLAPPVPGATRWEELITRHLPLAGRVTRPPDDLATIIYTSGSTGEPKGVMHSFRTMASAFRFVDLAKMTPADRLLSYLPLAHVAERAVMETGNFKVGYQLFFAEGLETFVKDLQRARPTLFGTVPRLWLKFQAGVFVKMPEQKLNRLLKLPLVNRLVKRKLLQGLGLDQVRWSVTGSAPTPRELLAWYANLGLHIGELYGMTENWTISHIALPGEDNAGTVGRVHEGVTCRIADTGEIQVKSPGTMLGYYKNPQLTAETVDAEGFLHTGDRGEIDASGRLRITGRVKELFKTSKGKYVAPAPIENRLMRHPNIEAVCVAGAGMPQPYALVMLSLDAQAQMGNAAARAGMERELSDLLDEVNSE
ncbi:MAG: AMP-binding protein, partial [Myxococcales bacterium]|nr:AMP-binding protein [Myxococcales bacterium]